MFEGIAVCLEAPSPISSPGWSSRSRTKWSWASCPPCKLCPRQFPSKSFCSLSVARWLLLSSPSREAEGCPWVAARYHCPQLAFGSCKGSRGWPALSTARLQVCVQRDVWCLSSDSLVGREHPRSCWCEDWYSCVCSINSSWFCWRRSKHDRSRGRQHPAAWSPGPLQWAALSEQVDVHGSGLCSSFCLLPLPPLQFYWVPSKRERRAADFPVGFPRNSFTT